MTQFVRELTTFGAKSVNYVLPNDEVRCQIPLVPAAADDDGDERR